ncbi:hypothetical protein [Variovorax sp. WS11]|uniref:hypothetical protein n=1 Tax=Variovorax sp. WS11 TaxID=1105204 RepID=UPI0011B248AC|nr:hypothetical protein [Variovorax sp. WS11]NDZ19016.1 hypothetical protein [Variovorax sp. WS11]
MNRRARSPTTNPLAAARWPRRANLLAEPAPGNPLESDTVHSSRRQASNESNVPAPAVNISAAALFSLHCARRGWRSLRPLQDDPQFNEHFVKLVQSSSRHFEGFVTIALAPGDIRIGQKSMDDAMEMRLRLGTLVPASMLATSTKGASELDVEHTRLLLKVVAFAEMICGVVVGLFSSGPPLHTNHSDPVDVEDDELDRLFGVAEAAWAEGNGLMPAARAEYAAERLHEAYRNWRRPRKRFKPSS